MEMNVKLAAYAADLLDTAAYATKPGYHVGVSLPQETLAMLASLCREYVKAAETTQSGFYDPRSERRNAIMNRFLSAYHAGCPTVVTPAEASLLYDVIAAAACGLVEHGRTEVKPTGKELWAVQKMMNPAQTSFTPIAAIPKGVRRVLRSFLGTVAAVEDGSRVDGEITVGDLTLTVVKKAPPVAKTVTLRKDGRATLDAEIVVPWAYIGDRGSTGYVGALSVVGDMPVVVETRRGQITAARYITSGFVSGFVPTADAQERRGKLLQALGDGAAFRSPCWDTFVGASVSPEPR